MRISSQGIELIQYFESCSLDAYPDPATGGAPWTIGWGSTHDVYPGMRITQQRADEILRDEDLPHFEVAVETLVRVPMTQGAFDALCSFAFNLGASALAGSTLLRKLNKVDFSGAADEFLRWNRAAGKVMLGLTRRRTAERALFLGADVQVAIAEGAAIA